MVVLFISVYSTPRETASIYQINDMSEYLLHTGESQESLLSGKSCGTDRIKAEHLKYADDRIYVSVTILFSMCISHGFIHEGIMYTIIILVIKYKKGDLCSKDNYRPIAITSFFLRCLNW